MALRGVVETFTLQLIPPSLHMPFTLNNDYKKKKAKRLLPGNWVGIVYSQKSDGKMENASWSKQIN